MGALAPGTVIPGEGGRLLLFKPDRRLAPAGVTALYGEVKSIAGKYLPNVQLRLDCAGNASKGTSDSLGRFLLSNIPSGKCQLETDGGGATDGTNTHGNYVHDVTITAGKTNQLGYIVWMTPLNTTAPTPIQASASLNQVITSPAIKGLEVHLPPNTVVRGSDGKVVNQLTITQIPAGRTPFPMPKNVTFPVYFTVQPGGAYVEVEGSRYAPGKGATIIYPNLQRAPAGAKAKFWNYDPENGGWKIYGTGAVSADRKSIVPDAGTVVGRFTGAMVQIDDIGGFGVPPPGIFDLFYCADCAADPVIPSTGQFYLNETDLALPDVMPVSLTRIFRSGDQLQRAFGIGATHPYDMFVTGDRFPYTYMDLVMPNGSRIHFTRTSPGSSFADAVYTHTTTQSQFYKSRRRVKRVLGRNSSMRAWRPASNSVLSSMSRTECLVAVSPCLRELREEFSRPLGVVGPLDFSPLRRERSERESTWG